MLRLALVILLIPSMALGVPSVTAVSGTVAHGNSLTIGGSSFTSWSPTTGAFDRLESGSFNSYWASTTQLQDNTNNNRNVNSSRNAARTITSHGVSDVRFQGGSTVGRSWYVSYWFKLSSSWDWGTSDFGGTDKFLSNIKLWRMWNPGSETENIYCQYKGDNNALEFIAENIGGSAPESFLSSARSNVPLNQWNQLRFQFVDSSSAGSSDGSIKIWFNGSLLKNQTGRLFKEDGGSNKRPFIVGFQNEWGCNEGSPDTEGCGSQTFYIDDVWAYDSIARVEVCQQNTYTACTYTELQPITSWGSSSIQITFNEGSLACGSNDCYVYVTDNTGATNANGFEIDGGGVIPPDPPAPSVIKLNLNGRTKLEGRGKL